MAAYNKIEVFVFDLGNGKHILPAAGDELRVYASNTQPLVTNEVFGVPAEITAENGYPAGGSDIQNDYTEATGIGTLVAGIDVIWTASGGTFGPLRFILLYNFTQTSPVKPLISWWDHGTSVTPADGETFTVDFGASVFTLT